MGEEDKGEVVPPPPPEIYERVMGWGPMEWQILAELAGFLDTTIYFVDNDMIVVLYEEDAAKRVSLLGSILKFSTSVEIGEWRYNEKVERVYGAVIDEMGIAMRLGDPWLGAMAEAMERPEAYLRGVIAATGEEIEGRYIFFTLSENGRKAIEGLLRLYEIPHNISEEPIRSPESLAEFPPLRAEGVITETAYLFTLRPEDAEKLAAAIGGVE